MIEQCFQALMNERLEGIEKSLRLRRRRGLAGAGAFVGTMSPELQAEGLREVADGHSASKQTSLGGPFVTGEGCAVPATVL